MARIVVIDGHPERPKSIANKAVLEEFGKLVPEAETVHLCELYPDFRIDASREQQRLAPAEMIIFQYPFWWYGAPSLLRRYLEQVFLPGWAYATEKKALAGKNLALSFTIGGTEAEYQRREGVMHTIEQFLPDMLATAHFTGMTYRGAVYSFDMACFDPSDQARISAVQAKARDQARRLKEHIAQFIALS
ncbi:MAG: NAD(P)H-dependent oxidoreductase [Desulfovibrio sp.]|nr:NAD(P)H-dependent oxidoreductase [Desulfovibrio sp.]